MILIIAKHVKFIYNDIALGRSSTSLKSDEYLKKKSPKFNKSGCESGNS